MDNVAATLLLLLVAGSALICLTSARNTACFNANGEIKRVFCDGREITKRLPNRMNPNKCDCIQMDVCRNITLRVKGYEHQDKGQSRSGIGVCQTARPTPYRNWVCRKSSMDKAWKSRSLNPRNANHWLPAQKTTRAKTCHGKKKLPCKPSMFWNAGVDAPSVDCIIQQCASNCKSCAVTGPGKCDPGMCYYGNGTDFYTGKTRCNRKCRLDMVAWGLRRNNPYATGTGYMKLTDMRSHSRDIIHVNKPGSYLAMVDMDECVFGEKYYSDWVIGSLDIKVQKGLLHDWIYIKPFKNRIAAFMQVGGTDVSTPGLKPGPGSPYAVVHQLGSSSAVPMFGYNRNCSVSAVFTGFNYGTTTLDSFVVNVPGTDPSPNTGC